MLILIVPAVVRLITENYSWDEISASNKFYESKVSIISQKPEKCASK